METLTLQHDLRPELPNIYGALDYRCFRDTLVKMDEIFSKSDLEHKIILQTLEQQLANNELNQKQLSSARQSNFHYSKLKHALRCNIARRSVKIESQRPLGSAAKSR